MRIIKAGVLFSLVLGAASAHALPPTATYDISLVIAGSAAVRDSVQLEVASLCQAGTLNTYRASPTAGQDFRAMSCTLISAGVPAAISGRNAIVYYRSEGDSIYGVAPLAKNLMVKRLLVNSLCTVAAPPAVGNCPVSGYNVSTDTFTSGNLVNSFVDVGVSDVEPLRFAGENWPAASPLFGPPAINAQLELIAAIEAKGGIFALAVNSASPVVSLTPTQARGIFTGLYSDWSDIPGAAFPAQPITVCRGTAGTGTQAATSIHFNRGTCSGGLPFVTAPSGPLGNPVIENITAAAESTCIASDPGAIGFLRYSSPPTAGVKLLAIRGISPSKAAVIDTSYEFWYEATFNRDERIAGRPLENLLANVIIDRVRASVSNGPAQLSLSSNPPSPETASCGYHLDSCGLCY